MAAGTRVPLSPNAQRVDDTDRSRLPSAKNTLPAPAPASAPAHEDLLEDEDEYAFDEDPDEEEKEECNYDADEETVLKYAFGNDTTDLDDYERFVMKPQAHPQVRKGMKKFAQQVIQAVRQNGLLEDPKGHFFTNLQPRRRIHAPVVYTILEAEQEPEGPASLKKGGQTSNPPPSATTTSTPTSKIGSSGSSLAFITSTRPRTTSFKKSTMMSWSS